MSNDPYEEERTTCADCVYYREIWLRQAANGLTHSVGCCVIDVYNADERTLEDAELDTVDEGDAPCEDFAPYGGAPYPKGCSSTALVVASDAVAPRLRCRECGLSREYTFWHGKLDFREPKVRYCPNCGRRIQEVLAHD